MNGWGIDDRPSVTWDDVRNFGYAIVAIVLFVLILFGMTAR